MSENEMKKFQARIVTALESKPDVRVPAAFAARVRLELSATQPVRATRFGARTAMVAAALLTAGLFALAPHAAASFSSLAFDMELLLLGELGGLAWWMASRRDLWQ